MSSVRLLASDLLTIDKNTKQITLPKKYNKTICNWGEVGAKRLFFVINKDLGQYNSDFEIDGNTLVTIYTTFNGRIITATSAQGGGITVENFGDQSKLITWPLPSTITSNEDHYYGPITITIQFEQTQSGAVVKRWLSNPCTDLVIGKEFETEPVGPGGDITQELINNAINDYIADNTFDINQTVSQ